MLDYKLAVCGPGEEIYRTGYKNRCNLEEVGVCFKAHMPLRGLGGEKSAAEVNQQHGNEKKRIFKNVLYIIRLCDTHTLTLRIPPFSSLFSIKIHRKQPSIKIHLPVSIIFE